MMYLFHRATMAEAVCIRHCRTRGWRACWRGWRASWGPCRPGCSSAAATRTASTPAAALCTAMMSARYIRLHNNPPHPPFPITLSASDGSEFLLQLGSEFVLHLPPVHLGSFIVVKCIAACQSLKALTLYPHFITTQESSAAVVVYLTATS